MEKRLILAIALSLFILLIWSALMPKPAVLPTAPTASSLAEKPKQTVTPAITIKPDTLPSSNISLDNRKITLIEPIATIKDITFINYQDYRFPLKNGFLLNDKNLSFSRVSAPENIYEFVQSDNDKKIIKRFIFSKSKYDLYLELEIDNLTRTALNFNIPIILGELDFAANQMQTKFEDVTVAQKNKETIHPNPRKDANFADLHFLALRDRYFCAIIQPEGGNFSAYIKKIGNQESEIGLIFQDLVVAPEKSIKQKFHIYLGPQELNTISAINSEWSAVMYYGTFNYISKILIQIVEFLHRVSHNWGIAIILLSVLIYLLLFPLSVKQMRSMKEMQAIQPEIEKLRKLYKDNPQRLNKETIELYKKHRVNPFSGCLPLILQIPIFFALYQALIRSIALKGAGFLWIKDLSEADRLVTLPISLPLIGNEINILPILMAIGMFVQQKITTAPTADASTAEQQKLMLIILPIVFGLVFYHMPSGLVLYWFVNSMMMLAYQMRIKLAK